jgi:hypothetical protein
MKRGIRWARHVTCIKYMRKVYLQRNHCVGVLGVGRRIILKWVREKYNMKVGAGFSWLRMLSNIRLL